MKLWWFAALLLASPAMAATTCSDIEFENTPYTICEVPAGAELRLWLTGSEGRILGSFAAVEKSIAPRSLSFAMNAGMYHGDRKPVGLYIENGTQLTGLSDGGGYGNFGLLPNGVFCVADRLRVIEAEAYRAENPACIHATQSGPMLVIGGKLHPRFLLNSPSRNIRNGVGTPADGSRAVFAISGAPVNFHQFARLFRDHLGLPDALFFDGSVSRLHAPDLGRSDLGLPLGPIIGTVD